MKIIHLLAAGAATLAVAVPAAAQYQYPQGYGQPAGQNALGQVINQLLGNRYNVTDRTAVTQCATAAMAQASAQYGPRGYNQGYPQGYAQPGYGQPGYNQGYNPAMRVTAVTDVQRRSRGLRVSGLIDSGMYAAAPYGQPGYGNQGYADPRYAQTGDLTFRCNVAYNGQVTDVRIGRNTQQYRR